MLKLEYGINMAGTETFRFAMNKNAFGRGLNAQTMPKALRFYLVPPPGRIFAQGDLSQAEARVVAYLSKCKQLIEVFNDPKRHVHQENAIAIFGHTVAKDSPEYVLAKGILHASNYRMGPHQFAVSTGMDIKTCKDLLEKYHGARPEIHRWHDWVWAEIKRCGTLETPLRDRRVFYGAVAAFNSMGKMLDKQWKDAIAWVPQATVPHVTNLGIIGMYDEFAKASDFCAFHHQGHDSFLVSIPKGEEQRFAESAIKHFTIQLNINGLKFVIPMELGFGYNFGDMMPWAGESITSIQWQTWLDNKLAKRDRSADVLAGTYGVHLSNWRPNENKLS